MKVVCWNGQAQNIAASVGKGTRVIVLGKLSQREAPPAEGEEKMRYFTEVVADQVGPSLQWATIEGKIVRSTSDELSGNAQAAKDEVNAEVF